MTDRLRVGGDPVITEDDATGEVTGDFDTINTERLSVTGTQGDIRYFETGSYPTPAPTTFGTAYEDPSNAELTADASASVVTDPRTRGESSTELTSSGFQGITFEPSSNVDIDGGAIYLRAYLNDTTIQNIYVKVAAPDFSNWGQYITNFNAPVENEWDELIVPISELNTQSGTPDYTNVGTVEFEFVPSGSDVTLTVDELSFYNGGLDRGKVAFMFDDNDASIDNHGKKVLDDYGFAGNWAWIPDVGGSALTIEDFGVRAARTGWHISIHGGTQFPNMTEAELRTHLQDAIQQLWDNGIQQRKSATYPNGAVDATSEDIVSNYCLLARGTQGDNWPPINPYRLPGNQSISNQSVSVTQTQIDNVAANNRAQIFVLHTLESGGGQLDISESDFDSIVSYADSADVDVVTVPEMVEAYHS